MLGQHGNHPLDPAKEHPITPKMIDFKTKDRTFNNVTVVTQIQIVIE